MDQLPGSDHLDLIDQHTAVIEQLTDRIEVVIEPFRGFRDLIATRRGPLRANVAVQRALLVAYLEHCHDQHHLPRSRR